MSVVLLSRVENGRTAKGDDGGGVWGDAAALESGDQCGCNDVLASGKASASVLLMDGDEGVWDEGDVSESSSFGVG